MKSNAIVRIILYSLLILILSGILLTVLGADLLSFRSGSVTTTGESVSTPTTVEGADVANLNIEWAAGSVTIVTGNTDQITFYESGDFEEKYAMVYSQKGDTLRISYARSSVSVGLGSIPSKDLTIIVPEGWSCQELEIDGAALEIEINGLTVKEFDIDGAANEIDFTGSFESLECDGAACELTLNCLTKPQKIDLDGASIQMDLYLPDECGFLVQMNGLSCAFRSDLDYTSGNGDYLYGDRYCKVYADGISCSVTVNHAPAVTEIE